MTKNVMKNSIFIVCFTFLTLLVFPSCNDGEDSSGCISFMDAGLSDSICLAESYSELCEGLSCSTDPEVYIPSLFRDCTPIDCFTLECGNVSFTDIVFNPETAQTSAFVILDGQDLGLSECSFVQP